MHVVARNEAIIGRMSRVMIKSRVSKERSQRTRTKQHNAFLIKRSDQGVTGVYTIHMVLSSN